MYNLIIEEKNFEKAFNEIDSLRETYFYNKNSFEYETEYSQNKLRPTAFIFYKKEEVLGAFFFTINENKEMDFFRRPCIAFWKSYVTSDDKYEIYQLLLNDFEKKLTTKQVVKMNLAIDSYLFSELQKFQVTVNHTYESFIDLSCTDSVIKRGIRKSFRSLVSWGNREMSFVRVDCLNKCEKSFEDFRQFHIKISGKETRSKASWALQFRMICEGHGFLELGFYGNEMVAGALFLTGETEAYYGVGVNNRDLMAEGKAIGHAVIFRSILHSKNLGLKICNLGKVGPSFSTDKEFGIAKFKKGFSSNIRLQTSFSVEIENEISKVVNS